MHIHKSVQLWHNREGRTWLNNDCAIRSDISKNELIIKSLFSLISTGTERIILNYALDDQTASEMRVPYMLGSFNSEFTYGYSMVGQVIEGEKEWVGKIIHVMHPHQDTILVDKSDVYAIPDEIEPKYATLASNLETAVNAIWDSGVSVGDRILILGFGIIGALLATVIRSLPGIEVYIYELDPIRQELCASLGFNAIIETKKLTKDYTKTFNTTCSQSGLQMAIDQVLNEGTVTELSWFGPQKISLNLGLDFHYGRKKIISSQVSHIPTSKSAHFDKFSRKRVAFNILKEIDFKGLLTREISFKEAPRFYEELRKGNPKDIGIMFQYK
jgi:threonine dehydrogenase-like Zn-dependent dehydrogenase